jgi:hypothetical protein
MIAWTKTFPKRERLIGYYRLLRARHRFYDRLGLVWGKKWRPVVDAVPGYQQKFALMRDKFRGRRCFIIANGPSLKDIDISKLRKEITMGCNGIYKMFPDWGFHTTYLMFEDIEQIELRRRDIHAVQGPIKMAAIYNAYCFKPDAKTLFFNAPRMRGQKYYWTDLYPQFSTDFAAVVHLGSTVTYIMLQLAYHLGCDPVYIVGLDHDYGELPKLFPPGKITITEENIHLVQGLHFSDKYYKVGDQIGVPFVEMQEKAYAAARKAFEEDGRQVLNASTHTCLDVFERCSFDDIMSTPTGRAGGKTLGEPRGIFSVDFSLWESMRGETWKTWHVEDNSELTGSGVYELVLTPRPGKGGGIQTECILPDEVGGMVEVTAEVMASAPGKVALNVYADYDPDNEEDRSVRQCEHPGDGNWHTLTTGMPVDPKRRPYRVRVAVVVRQDAPETRVRRLNADFLPAVTDL